jgi:hypothetical protein
VTSGPSSGGMSHVPHSKIPQFHVSSISVLSSPSHGYQPFSYHPNLHIIVKIKLWSGKDWIQTYAMIDSGASISFIDVRWARRFIAHLFVHKSNPFQVSLGDGELAKTCRVTEEVQAQIAIGEHEESNLCLSVTKLSYPIMLGISWLKQHDPWIHWSQHCITFNSPHCLSSGHIHEPTTVLALAQCPQDTLSEVGLELEPNPVVAVEFNQQDIPLSVVEPKPRPLSKTPVVALAQTPQETLSEVERDSVRTGPVWAGLPQFPRPAQGNENTGPDHLPGIRLGWSIR